MKRVGKTCKHNQPIKEFQEILEGAVQAGTYRKMIKFNAIKKIL